MLNWYINVFTDLRFFCHDFDQFIRYPVFVAIHKSNPFNAVNSAQFFEKFRKHIFSVQIDAVISNILCNENQFLAACCRKLFGFLQNIFDSFASVSSADRRNYAICTSVIASFGYFYG